MFGPNQSLHKVLSIEGPIVERPAGITLMRPIDCRLAFHAQNQLADDDPCGTV